MRGGSRKRARRFERDVGVGMGECICESASLCWGVSQVDADKCQEFLGIFQCRSACVIFELVFWYPYKLYLQD